MGFLAIRVNSILSKESNQNKELINRALLYIFNNKRI
jgi:hypothetical protein